MKDRGIVCARSIAPRDASMSGFHSGRKEQGDRPTSAAEKRDIRAWLQFLEERQVAALCTPPACEQAQIVQIENTTLASEYVSLALIMKQRGNVISERMFSIRAKTAAPSEMLSHGEVQEFVRYESCLEEPFELKAARET